MLVILLEHCILLVFAWTSISCVFLLIKSNSQAVPPACACICLFVLLLLGIIYENDWKSVQRVLYAFAPSCVSQSQSYIFQWRTHTLNWYFTSSENQEFSTVSGGGGVRICNVFHNKTAIASFMLGYLSTIHQVILLFFTSLATFMNQVFPFVAIVTQWWRHKSVSGSLVIEYAGKSAKK